MAVLYTRGNYKCVTRVTELTSPGTSSEASTTVQASVDAGFSETDGLVVELDGPSEFSGPSELESGAWEIGDSLQK